MASTSASGCESGIRPRPASLSWLGGSVVIDTPFAGFSPTEPGNPFNLDAPDPVAHADLLPPEEQPANDRETTRSVATAVLTARKWFLRKWIAITSLARRLIRSCSHFLTRSRSNVVLAREAASSRLCTGPPAWPVTPTFKARQSAQRPRIPIQHMGAEQKTEQRATESTEWR